MRTSYVIAGVALAAAAVVGGVLFLRRRDSGADGVAAPEDSLIGSAAEVGSALAGSLGKAGKGLGSYFGKLGKKSASVVDEATFGKQRRAGSDYYRRTIGKVPGL